MVRAAVSVIVVLCGHLLASFAVAIQAAQTKKPQSKKEQTPKAALGEQAIRQARIKKVDVEFKDTPLGDAIEKLRATFSVNIIIDKVAWDQEGIGPDRRVTAKPSKVNLESALDSILEPLGLDWVVADDVVQITSRKQARTVMDARVYEPAKAAEKGSRNAVIKDITSKVAPETWNEVGGPGVIGRFQGVLVVRQSQPVHRQIEKLRDVVRLVPHAERVQLRGAGPGGTTVRQALASPCSVDFTGQPLQEVLSHLQDAHKVKIAADEAALNAEGIGMETPVTMHVENVPLGSALKLILSPLNLTCVEQSGTVQVTSRLRAGQVLESRSYDVRDLAFPSAPGAGGESIPNLVQKCIAPNTWSTVGGSGTLEVNVGRLTLEVKAAPQVHAEIEQLFADVRKVVKKK